MNADSIAEKDLLGREGFATEFAQMLIASRPNGSDGIVIGVTGKWGCGKTTFLSFAKKHLQELHKAKTAIDNSDSVIMDFNPWMYNCQKELQSIFLRDVAEKSGNQNEALKKFLTTLSDRLLIPKLLSSAEVKIFGYSINLSKFKDLFKSDIEKLRKDVDVDLTTKNRYLYIVIDDIDRLEPQSIIDMLQLIRLNANFKNTAYILAYDKFYVNRVLKDLYKESGDNYLEKIVQVEFGIPEIREDQLENIFFEQMKEFFTSFKIPYEESQLLSLWKYRGLRDFFATLRDVYRFINSLQMRLPQVHREVNIYDFVMVECLRLFEYAFFAEIVSELAKGRYHRNFARAPFYEKDEKKFSKAQRCFKYLDFFQTEVYAIMNSNEKRFADPAYTERYFALSLSPKDIAQVEYDSFFHKAAQGELDAFMDEVYRYDRMPNLLRRLKATREAGSIDWELIGSFLSYWSERPLEFDEFFIEIIDTVVRFIEISDDATGLTQTLLEQITRDAGKLDIVTFYLLFFFLEHFETQSVAAGLRAKVGALVALKKEEISKAYRSILQKWISYMMNRPAENRYGKMGWFYIAQYAKFEKAEYRKQFEFLCEKVVAPAYKDILGFAKEVLFLSSDGSFHRFAANTFDIIPKSYFAQFTRIVRAIENSQLTPEELRIKNLFLEKAPGLDNELRITDSL